jgi:hypothetical protein
MKLVRKRSVQTATRLELIKVFNLVRIVLMGKQIKMNGQEQLKIYAGITDAIEVMQKSIAGFKGLANGRNMIWELINQ